MSNLALSRLEDPDTAHAAADSLGNVTDLEQLVLNKLKATPAPGATTYELAEWLNLSLVSVSPRMRPLAKKRLIVDTGFRSRGASGRMQIIWRAT
jgi:hypothetical protein